MTNSNNVISSRLNPLGINIWTVEQPANLLGVPLGLRMTIVRLNDQQLAIHSMIPCEPETDAAIRDLGEVSYLIAPNLEHTRFIGEWQQRYPDAVLYAPSTELLTQHPSLNHDNKILPFQHDNLQCLALNGIPRLREFIFFHTESKTLILTDLAFNIGNDISLWAKCFMQLNGAYDRFTSSRILKSWIKDKTSFRLSIRQLMQWDFEQIVMAHGTPITADAKQTFRQAFKWVL